MKFAGVDIGELSQLSLAQLAELLRPVAAGQDKMKLSVEKRLAAQRIAQDLLERVSTLTELGLGYLSLSAAHRPYRPESCSDCAWPHSWARNYLA